MDAIFSLSSASRNNIPIEGILYLNVALSDQVLKVSFLVAHDYVSGLSEPILGYNVIQCMLQDKNIGDMKKVFKDCLHDGKLQARINKLIREMAHMNDVSDFICNVKVGRQKM